jgi:hypothetical protein
MQDIPGSRRQRVAHVLIATLSVALVGCPARQIGDLTRNNPCRTEHVVTIDPDGAAIDPTTYQELPQKAFEEQLNTIAAAIGTSGKKKLLVFVHGGLNNREAGQQHVDELQQHMLDAGYYPIFLNWNSDLWSTLGENLVFIRQGRRARYLGPPSAPFMALAGIGYGLLRTPLVLAEMLSSDINATHIQRLAFPGKLNSQALAAEWRQLYKAHDRAAIPLAEGDEQISAWDSATAVIRYALTLPTKIVLSPLIDGLGQGAWQNMLRRTEMLFHRESEFDVRDGRDDQEALRQLIVQGQQGGGYQLFLFLENYMCHHPEIEVTLVGHSMGTIVLNRALRQFPNFPATNVVYMAAACTIEDFRTSVVPFLLNRGSARFFSLMLHPSAEVREWQTSFLDLTPRGSLLVWIDNFLGSPNTTLGRTLGSWENVMQAAHVIPIEMRPRTSFRALCVGENCTEPVTHSSFTKPDVGFWCPEFWQVPPTP